MTLAQSDLFAGGTWLVNDEAEKVNARTGCVCGYARGRLVRLILGDPQNRSTKAVKMTVIRILQPYSYRRHSAERCLSPLGKIASARRTICFDPAFLPGKFRFGGAA